VRGAGFGFSRYIVNAEGGSSLLCRLKAVLTRRRTRFRKALIFWILVEMR
jgi:hypothetical protein